MELYQIYEIIKKRILLIALIVILSTSSSFIFSRFYTKPMYRATATLIIGKISNQVNEKIQYNDIMMYQKLAKTYAEIAKSKKVAERTLDLIPHGITPEKLQSSLTATPGADTEVLYLSITNEDPLTAAISVNVLSSVFIARVRELMKVDNVQVLDYAKPPAVPFKPNIKLNTAIAFFLGIMISLGLVFLIEYTDRTIRSVDDATKLLNLPVVGIIPLNNA